MFVLCSQGVLSADVVSCWSLNDAPVNGKFADILATNLASYHYTAPGGPITSDTFEGTGAFKMVGSKDFLGCDSTVGLSINEGTYIFSYKKDGTVSDWSDLLGTNLKKDSNYPLRLEHTTGTGLRLYVSTGTGLSSTYDAASTLFDGDWHTVALTYADADKIRVYVDGTQVIESTDNYSASAYTMNGYVTVGNVYPWYGEAKSAAGLYDRVILFDNALTVEELPTYLDPSYLPEPVVVLLEGDANRDGMVSGADYASVQSHFGESGVFGIPGDANGDGVVSAGDFASVQANFGSVATEAAPGVVPEPATIALLSFGFVALARRRK